MANAAAMAMASRSSWGALLGQREGLPRVGAGRGRRGGAHLERNWTKIAWARRSTVVFVALFVGQGKKSRETESWLSGAAWRAWWWRGEQLGARFIGKKRRWRRAERLRALQLVNGSGAPCVRPALLAGKRKRLSRDGTGQGQRPQAGKATSGGGGRLASIAGCH